MVAKKSCQDLLTDLAFLALNWELSQRKALSMSFHWLKNFSEPIGLKQFHHGIPEHEKAERCTNIVIWEVRARHLLFGKI